jgi:hypothetical protein
MLTRQVHPHTSQQQRPHNCPRSSKRHVVYPYPFVRRVLHVWPDPRLTDLSHCSIRNCSTHASNRKTVTTDSISSKGKVSVFAPEHEKLIIPTIAVTNQM